MLAARAITPVTYVPHCVNPLGVVPKLGSAKLRLVLNMRFPNSFLRVTKFRLESLADLRDIVEPDDYTLSFDMTQGYYHVGLHPSSRTFCGFEWRGQFYTYSVLSFGLATAPRCFAKIMNVLVRLWRRDGVRVIAYLDDWLFLTKRAEAIRLRDRVLSDCARAHVAINREKSTAHPVKVITHMGFEVHLRDDFLSRSNHVGIACRRISGLLATAVGRPLDNCQQ